MNGLRHLQEHFQEYLLHHNGPIEDAIHASEKVDARTRIEIYAEAYRLRLLEALETDYIALRAYLGKQRFEALGRAYIDTYPSDRYSLRYFGRHLNRFLAQTPAYAADGLLSELAAFDWALTEAFDAADSVATAVDQMAAVSPDDWPALRFVPHASIQRLDLHWNAPAIWKAADQNQEVLPHPERSEIPIAFIVWRQDLKSYYRALTVDEAWAVDAMKQGADFAAICEGLCEWIDAQNVALHAASLLKLWITDGLIHEIVTAR